MSFSLVKRRESTVFTWQAWLLILLLVISLIVTAVRCIYSFLAVSTPVHADTLIVEGWMPVAALSQAVGEFERGKYRVMLVTGGPIESGSLCSAFRSYAEFGASSLKQLGVPSARVYAVASEHVPRDRTLAAAEAVKRWLNSDTTSADVNVITLGTHARRTRLLFERAFGDTRKIGIIAVADRDFEPAKWWASSSGFRDVLGETIAYLYARLHFGSGSGDEAYVAPITPDEREAAPQ